MYHQCITNESWLCHVTFVAWTKLTLIVQVFKTWYTSWHIIFKGKYKVNIAGIVIFSGWPTSFWGRLVKIYCFLEWIRGWITPLPLECFNVPCHVPKWGNGWIRKFSKEVNFPAGCQFPHWRDTIVCQISAPRATLPGQFPGGHPPSPPSRKQLIGAWDRWL